VRPEELAKVLARWLPKKTTEIPQRAPAEDQGTTVVSAQEPEDMVFDKAGMMRRLMDDEELAITITKGFLDDLPGRIEELKGHLGAGDALGVKHVTHSIKGAAANLGGNALSALAADMEKKAKAGELEAVTDSLPELEKQFFRLKEEMGKHFQY